MNRYPPGFKALLLRQALRANANIAVNAFTNSRPTETAIRSAQFLSTLHGDSSLESRNPTIVELAPTGAPIPSINTKTGAQSELPKKNQVEIATLSGGRLEREARQEDTSSGSSTTSSVDDDPIGLEARLHPVQIGIEHFNSLLPAGAVLAETKKRKNSEEAEDIVKRQKLTESGAGTATADAKEPEGQQDEQQQQQHQQQQQQQDEREHIAGLEQEEPQQRAQEKEEETGDCFKLLSFFWKRKPRWLN